MFQLIETIKLQDGCFNNLRYHEQRMNHSLKELYKVDGTAELNTFLESLNYPQKGLYKCRLVYDSYSKTVEFTPHTFKPVTSLTMIEANVILYDHKYSNRAPINYLMDKRGGGDDILIIKDGWVTDCSYANIVFKSGSKWFTPHTYLLKGTMRESLLDAGAIEIQPIKVHDIKKFEKFKLINAMLGFDGAECDISNIL